MTVNVIGLGYIGLPTALILAAHGTKVIGTDLNSDLIERLNRGCISFEEDGIKELFEQALDNQIKFSREYVKANVYIVAVPTPYMKRDKKVDASFVIKAVEHILEVCEKNSIIVIESTISPGTINKCIRPIIENRGWKCGVDVHLVHAPERIIPGNMIHELVNNNRTVGADDMEVGNQIRVLYQTFCQGQITVTNIKTAEMTKVVENTYRDINIAFANELAKICRADNMDVYEIIKIANMHPRVNILMPGPGVGGHCISVDPWFLVGDYPGLANIILAARKINDSMPEFVLERMAEIMEQEEIQSVDKVGLYGLTYKEDIDDVRESPTLQLLECMKKHLANGIKVYDPYVKKNIVPNQYQDFEAFISDIDFIVIMVGHAQILQKMECLKGKIILDTRNICDSLYAYRI
ncbi:MAG: nucleotide sugar dehydrogenase [Lachnospiraceae bacterium]|nr:nucleotide sugar dehydrogenase [Lachnospiraceae bacterium]